MAFKTLVRICVFLHANAMSSHRRRHNSTDRHRKHKTSRPRSRISSSPFRRSRGDESADDDVWLDPNEFLVDFEEILKPPHVLAKDVIFVGTMRERMTDSVKDFSRVRLDDPQTLNAIIVIRRMHVFNHPVPVKLLFEWVTGDASLARFKDVVNTVLSGEVGEVHFATVGTEEGYRLEAQRVMDLMKKSGLHEKTSLSDDVS